MKKIILYTLLVFVLFGANTARAQNTLKQADTLFSHQHYSLALPIYKKLYVKDSVNQGLALQIGRIYNYTKDYPTAEKWYGKAGSAKLLEDPERMYEYALLLNSNGKYAEAATAYRAYNKKVPQEVNALALAKNADSIALAKNGMPMHANAKILPLTGPNTKYADFSPYLYKDQLFFLTDRVAELNPKQKKKQKTPVYLKTGIAYSFAMPFKLSENQMKLGDTTMKKPAVKLMPSDTSFLAVLRKEKNVGQFCLNAKQDTLFFSRVRLLENEVDAKGRKLKNSAGKISYNELCFLVKKGEAWSAVQVFPYNNFLKYSMMHPALSPDGNRLFFSSNRPGSLGKFDIFYCDREANNVWSVPVNAGSAINTVGSELFPFVDDQNTLFLASDGHLGYGGLDLFSTSLIGFQQENTKWPIAHLPEPINSSADEFGMYVFNPSLKTQKYGVLSSNRAGGMGLDDLYSFYLNTGDCPVEILVIDKMTKKPISNVMLHLDNTPKDSTGVKLTDAMGKATLALKDCGADRLVLTRAEYVTLKDSISAKNGQQSFVFEMEKQKGYSIEGNVTDYLTKKTLDSAQIEISVEKNFFKTIEANKDGFYTVVIGKNMRYNLLAKRKGYFSKRSEMVSTINSPDGSTFKVNFELEKVVLNKEITIQNIYYDFAKATLRKNSLPELDKLRDMLVDNPELKVELSAHTDARGNDNANMILSQNRAASVVKYLVSKGVSSRQLISKGYGESKLINRCANGVNCSEAEHEQNRRTEFKVIGFIKPLPKNTGTAKVTIIKPVKKAITKKK